MDKIYKEGAIMVETGSAKFNITRGQDGQILVTIMKGIGTSEVSQGGFLRLSLKESFLINSSKETLTISNQTMPMTELKTFILKTENSKYLITFDPATGLFRFKKTSGSNKNMRVDDSIYPAYLDFQQDGTLKLFDALGHKIYKTSCIEKLIVAYW